MTPFIEVNVGKSVQVVQVDSKQTQFCFLNPGDKFKLSNSEGVFTVVRNEANPIFAVDIYFTLVSFDPNTLVTRV
jgi:hypothetical protein